MDDLIAFLKARLDEKQELAESAQPGPWGAWPSEQPGEFVVHHAFEDGRKDPHRVATSHGLHRKEWTP